MFTNSRSTLLPALLGMAALPSDLIGASDLRQVTEDLLAAEAAVPSGALIGYARVSTEDQFLDRRITRGLAAAKARGRRLGRSRRCPPEQVEHARALLTQSDATIASIARLLGVSRSTIYKYVPELATGRPVAEQPTARAELEAGH
ncbi:recombinase family protein [Streptosporangium sandarakinum]|uniref:recombinase family protein n=1 Tax=Streptosporangium sandarakinum TaxID=1260955 RepID=UPI0033A4A8A2